MPAIPVGTETTARATRRVEFCCRRCGCRKMADVVGVGTGVQSFLNSPGTAEVRARRDAEKEIDRTIRRARCPSCRQRNPGALLRFLAPYLLTSAAFMLLGIIGGYAPTWFDLNMGEHDREICKWLLPLIVAVSILLVIPITASSRWSTTDSRVKWVE